MFLLRCLPEWMGIRRDTNRMRRASAEHVRRGPLSKFLDWLLDAEVRRLAQAGSIAFGASCIVVATKGAEGPSIGEGA